MPPIIEVENISKVYRLGEIGITSLRDEAARYIRKLKGKEPLQDEGEFWALKDVSFKVEEGDVIGIIGKNGAGKSTLLKIISRITEPSDGRIRLRGRVAALLEVGTGFHQELTGRENIYLNGTILGMRKREIDRKLDEIIDFSGIEKHIDTPVKRYSSGMNVRLGFAVAAHLEPEILIVDEVLAVGDAEFQRKCLGKMQDVSNTGRTVLFVSHNMASINTLTSRCILLDKGAVVADAPTNLVVEKYTSINLDTIGSTNPNDYKERGNLHSDVEITNIEVAQQDAVLNADSDLVFKININCTKKLINPSICINLISQNQTVISTFLAKDVIDNYTLPVGNTSCVVKIANIILKPGSYYLNIGINRQVGGELLEYIERYPLMQIKPIVNGQNMFRENRPGYFVPKSLTIDFLHGT